MGTFHAQFKKLGSAANTREFLDYLPVQWLQFLMALPAIWLALSPAVIFLIRWFIPYYRYDFPIPWTMAVFFCVSFYLYYLKERKNTNLFSFTFSQDWPLFVLFLLVVWMVVSSVINWDTTHFFECSYKYAGSLYTNLLNYLMWFWCGYLLRNRRIRNWVLVSFVLGGAVLSLSIAFNAWIYPLPVYSSYDSLERVQAIFLNPNYYAYYLVFQILICGYLWLMSERRKTLWLILYLLHISVLVMNRTMGSYLAVLLTLCFSIIVFLLWNPQYVKSALVLIAVFFAVSVVVNLWGNQLALEVQLLYADLSQFFSTGTFLDSAGSNRMLIWRKSISYIWEKPFLGHGYDALLTRLASDIAYLDPEVRPHNEFMEYACSFGIPAMIFYVVGMLGIYLRGLKLRKLLSPASVIALLTALGYLASSFFGCQIAMIVPYLFIFLGIGYQTEDNG